MKTENIKEKSIILLKVCLVIVFIATFVFYPIYRYRVSTVLSSNDARQSTDSIVVEQPSVFEKKLSPIYSDPARLYFASVNIDMQLVKVAVTADGKMETPKNWSEGGWFKMSARPGEKGNLIVNAHYDNNYGGPAAFWELKNVSENDNVYVIDELGKVHTYKVTELFYIDTQDPDRLRIFEEAKDKSELTLITCSGVWSYGSGYSKRLVVKGELVKDSSTAFVPTKDSD